MATLMNVAGRCPHGSNDTAVSLPINEMVQENRFYRMSIFACCDHEVNPRPKQMNIRGRAYPPKRARKVASILHATKGRMFTYRKLFGAASDHYELNACG